MNHTVSTTPPPGAAVVRPPRGCEGERCDDCEGSTRLDVSGCVGPTVGVLKPANLPKGTQRSRLCGEDRDRETENSKVAQEQGTQDLYRFGPPE
jgi:hypothetical protein